MPPPTLILGLAAGYHYGDVRPFLASLERVGYAGEVVLFVSPTTRDLPRMAAHGARIESFERPAEFAHVPYNAWRFFLYRDFLAHSEGEYARILLTDVRDVIFQREPFAHPWPEGLSVTLEDRRMTVGACEHMRRWTEAHLGGEALTRLADRPIACSGTSVGGLTAVRDYLDAMCARLLPFTPGPRLAGYDQAVHNLLVHEGRLAGVNVVDNSGPVLTLGYVLGEPERDAEGQVLAASGRPAHIVHQYDRKPALFAHIRRCYA